MIGGVPAGAVGVVANEANSSAAAASGSTGVALGRVDRFCRAGAGRRAAAAADAARTGEIF
jgi:hypothetical protein